MPTESTRISKLNNVPRDRRPAVTSLQRISNAMIAIGFVCALAVVLLVCCLALFQPDLGLTRAEHVLAIRLAAAWLLWMIVAFLCLCFSR
jgi:hypothetical protein